MFSIFWNLIFFIILIGVLVTIHELGHFLVARFFGVKVYRFSIGFGPSVLKWRGKDGTEYVIAALPLGGYVKMKGESDDFVQQYDKEGQAKLEQEQKQKQAQEQGGQADQTEQAFQASQTEQTAQDAPAAAEPQAESQTESKSKLIADTDFAELRTGTAADNKDGEARAAKAAKDAEAAAGAGTDNGSNKPEVHDPDSYLALSCFKRFLILFAGPFSNIILAFVVFTGLNLMGLNYLKPVVGDFANDSVAAQSGFKYRDLIQKVDGQPVQSWSDMYSELTTHASEKVTITVAGDLGQEPSRDVVLDLTDVDFSPNFSFFDFLGFREYLGNTPLALAIVVEDSLADQKGIVVGDLVIGVNQKVFRDWRWVYDAIEELKKAGEDVNLYLIRERKLFPSAGEGKASLELRETILIDGKEYTLPQLLEYAQKNFPNSALDQGLASLNLADYAFAVVTFPLDPEVDNSEMRFGVAVESVIPKEIVGTTQTNLFSAMGDAFTDTARTSVIVLKTLEKLIVGDIDARNVSGPVSIAKVAGESASVGFEAFLWMLGLISINVGVFNLLPVPVLDGGQIVYVLYEAITKRKPNAKMQGILATICFSLLMVLMVFTIFNDLFFRVQ